VVTSSTGAFAGSIASIGQPFRSNVRGAIASMRFTGDALYAQSFMPDEAPPPIAADVFNWQIEEETGTVLGDATLNGIDGVLIGGATWSMAGPGCP
jgi:hypothetical protein